MRRILLTLTTTAALLALLTGGCSVEQPDGVTVAPLSGDLFFADYVAVGNSLTAGFMDAGLVMNGQLNSFPRLIATQLGFDTSVSASATWTQPWIAFPGVGSTGTGDPSLVAGVLYWNGAGIVPTDIYPVADVPSKLLAALVPTPYNNLGVPGAALVDVLHATDAATSILGNNSYFDFILRNPNFGDTTQLQQCVGGKPTMVTLWIGNNDVLGGATSGSPQVGIDPLAGDNITPPAAFAALFEDVVDGILTGVQGATGFAPLLVAANIPSITTIPYFIPEAVFTSLYPFGYVEADVSLVRFPALSWIAIPGNQGQPLPADYTLSTAEVTTVENTVDAYNTSIATICADHGVPVVDMRALLTSLTQPERTHFVFLVQGGMDVATAAATTFFSLDGIHPNNRGYGVVANAFIGAINAAAGTSVPYVNTASLVWDPTYGQKPLLAAHAGPPGLSPEAAAVLDAVFQRP